MKRGEPSARKQVNILLSAEAIGTLDRIGEMTGKPRSTLARDMLEDLLRDEDFVAMLDDDEKPEKSIGEKP